MASTPGSDATCPFCGAAWSADMLARYDAARRPGGCACCFGGIQLRTTHAPATSRDLRCDTCGRAIYRAVAVEHPSAP